MEENEVRPDYPMSELTIVVCLLLQMAGRTFSQETASEENCAYDNYNDYSIDMPTNQGLNDTPLECYSCGAYQHRDGQEFDAKLKSCRDYVETAEIETCPNFCVGSYTYRFCGITVQMVFGHVTSYSRGCHYLRPCKELSFCSGVNNTGVCQYCCSTSLCNHGNVLSLSVPLLLLVVIVTWIYHFR